MARTTKADQERRDAHYFEDGVTPEHEEQGAQFGKDELTSDESPELGEDTTEETPEEFDENVAPEDEEE